MRIGVTGPQGRIGSLLLQKGCVPLDCDVTKLEEVEKKVAEAEIDVICHLASLSDPDFCEKPENKDQVIRVNLRGTYNVCLAAQEKKVGVVLLSTDHIFDGKRGPYRETEIRAKRPVNFYGMSKMSAEALTDAFSNLKIVRTSYLFSETRIREVFLDAKVLEFPTFYQRSFMWDRDFADQLYRYLERFLEMPKVLHLSGSDTVSWYEFALVVASVFGLDKSRIHPRKREIKDEHLAPRPHKAGLNTRLASRFLKPVSYVDGLMSLKERMECSTPPSSNS